MSLIIVSYNNLQVVENQKNKEKKIYGIPLSLARRINKEVDKSNSLVIANVLARIDAKMQQTEYRELNGVNEDWHKHHRIEGEHSKGCGCTYCIALHLYIKGKISAHRMRRRLDSYNYVSSPYEDLGYNQLHELEKEWPELREKKENIRILAGLPRRKYLEV